MAQKDEHFSTRLLALDAQSAAALLDLEHPNLAAQQLSELPPARAMAILLALPEDIREQVMSACATGSAWIRAEAYALGTVGAQLGSSVAPS